MKEFMEYDNNKPVVLEARITKEEHCYPMARAHLRSLDRQNELLTTSGEFFRSPPEKLFTK